MEWHQRHPTGQLLSNANSDVEAAWGPIAPLPMAVGTRRDDGDRGRPDVPRRPGAGAGRAAGLPAGDRSPTSSTSGSPSPLMTRAQQLRAELSEIAHESFDGAMVVKTLGPRGRGDRSGSPRRPHELRDINIRAGRVRAAFDPVLAALPSLGVLVVLVGRRRRGCSAGATDAGDVVTVAYLLTIVVVPDPLDRLAARRVPAQRRRLPTGSARCSRRPARCSTATRGPARRRRRRPARGRRTSATPTTPTSGCSTTSPSPSSRAAPSPWSAPPPPARAR